MRKYLLLFFMFVFAIFSSETFAQEDQDETDSVQVENELGESQDEWEDDEWEDCEDDEWDSNWSWDDDDFMGFEFNGRPTMELLYLSSEMGLKSIGTKFNQAGAAGVRLGYSSLREYEEYIIRYKNGFIFLSNFSDDFRSKEAEAGKLKADVWRFGFGSMTGYGYKFGSSAIIPYQTNSFDWTRLDFSRPATMDLNNDALTRENETLNLFDESFRFGSMTEAGIRFQVIPLLNFNVGFERSLVYPRFMVWKSLGSSVIEWIGLGATDAFVREVLDSSPAAGPIINFLLKNAVSFGMYQLRRDKMAWPFATAAPLTIDSWKFGVTFAF